MAKGSIRESMQVTMAMPALAIPSKPPSVNVSAYRLLLASRSSKLMGPPFRRRCYPPSVSILPRPASADTGCVTGVPDPSLRP